MASPFAAYPAPTRLDRVIGWLSPGRGLARYFDRIRLARAYEAASPRDGWRPVRPGASANADHMADAARVRAKARALVQNVPYIRAALEALVSNTIGTGIITYPTGPNARRVEALWSQWCRVCDADGRLEWSGIQAAAERAMEQDGEVLLRLRTPRPSAALPAPLQLQLLEIDWLDTSRTSGAAGPHQIVEGIEYDAIGRPVAYWLWDQHPGDSQIPRGGRVRRESRRVPAEQIIHLFAPERPGQGRGFSRFAPVIVSVRDLQLYMDAEAARKNLETRLSVLVSGDVKGMANPPMLGEPIDQAKAEKTGDLGELPSGGISSLPPGVNITTVAPTAAPGYVEYVKQQLHLIAAGIGVTYEMMTGDMLDVNFSSARVKLIDFRREREAHQWLVLVPRLIVPVYRAFIDAAALVGAVPDGEYACDHTTPKWDYVNPKDDTESDLRAISGALTTPSESLRRRGYKPDEVFAELKSDFDRLRNDGTLDVLLALQGKAPRRADDDDAGAAAATKRAEDLFRQAMERAASATDRQIVVNNHVAPASVTVPATPVELRVEAPSVSVASPAVHVDVAAPEVRVDPPSVHVDVAAPDVHVDVAPPAVRVDNSVTVSTPRRRIDSMVERDDKGRMLRTTSIETDLPSPDGSSPAAP